MSFYLTDFTISTRTLCSARAGRQEAPTLTRCPVGQQRDWGSRAGWLSPQSRLPSLPPQSRSRAEVLRGTDRNLFHLILESRTLESFRRPRTMPAPRLASSGSAVRRVT